MLSGSEPDSLSKLGLLQEGRLVEAKGGGEDEGRVVLLKEGVDDVKEATKVAILVVVADRDERRGHVRRDTNGVLNVQALFRGDE